MSGILLEISEPLKPARRLAVLSVLTIGRGSDNDVVLDDSKVSEHHALVTSVDGDLLLQDLGSTNQTHVFRGPSLKKDESWQLTLHSRFMVGDTEFVLVVGESDDEATFILPPPSKVDPKKSEPQKIPADGVVRGPILAPNSGLAPVGPDGSETAEEKFPHLESGLLKSDELPAEVAPHSEEKTTSQRLPRFEDLDEETGIVPRARMKAEMESLLESSARRGGPDPDESTIMSPSPADLATPEPDDDDKATVLSADPSRFADIEATTNQVVVKDVVDAESATVLSPQPTPNVPPMVEPDSTTKASKPGFEPHELDQGNEKQTLLRVSDSDVTAQTPGRFDVTVAPRAESTSNNRFAMMRPRLVFSDVNFKFVSRIFKDNFLVGRAGRAAEAAVDCPLDHPTVSGQHGAVLYRDGQFFFEDRGSRNGTVVDGHDLQVMTRRELKPDTALRVGRVDAVFLLDRDENLAEPSRDHYRGALEILVRNKTIRSITAETLWQTASRENQHPGEKLILEGRVTVKQWCDAVKLARAAQAGKKSESRKWQWLALGASAIALVMIAFVLREVGILSPF